MTSEIKYVQKFNYEQFERKITQLNSDLIQGKWMTDTCETRNKDSRFVRWIKCLISAILPFKLYTSIKVENVVPAYFKLIEENREHLKNAKLLASTKNILEFLNTKTKEKHLILITKIEKQIDGLINPTNEKELKEVDTKEVVTPKPTEMTEPEKPKIKTPAKIPAKKTTKTTPKKETQQEPKKEIPEKNIPSEPKETKKTEPVEASEENQLESFSDNEKLWFEICKDIAPSNEKSELKPSTEKLNIDDFFHKFLLKKYPLEKGLSKIDYLKKFKNVISDLHTDHTEEPNGYITFEAFDRFVNYFGPLSSEGTHVLTRMNGLIAAGLYFGFFDNEKLVANAKNGDYCIRFHKKDLNQINLVIKLKNKFAAYPIRLEKGMLKAEGIKTTPVEKAKEFITTFSRSKNRNTQTNVIKTNVIKTK